MTHRHTSKLYQGPCCCFTSTDPDLDSYKTTKKKNAESLKRKLCPSPDEIGCIPLKSELSGVEDIDTSLDIDDDSKTNLTSRKTTQGRHTKTTNPNPCIKSLLPNTIKTAAVAPIYNGYSINYHGNSFTSHENIFLSCSEGIDHDCGRSFDSSSCRPVVSLPLKRPNMNDCPESSKVKHSLESLCVLSDNMEEIKESNETVNISVPNNSAHPDVPVNASDSGVSTRSHRSSSSSQDCSLIHQEPPATITNLTQDLGLPNMKLHSIFEEFTPGFTGDEDDETYWFQCSSPGLYQCRLSSLVIGMKGEGDVFYRIVPWSRTLLSQHGKKPAGPLFDIRCQQQSVVQLHLPHCEIRSTGGCDFLSVAHVHNRDIEFIRPEKITETHVIINITGFSAFGNVKDEDSPPDPVQSLVLLFYKPPTDSDVTSFLNVLILPRNIVIWDLMRTRKKLAEDELFIETPPHCKLVPKQLYSLTTCPKENWVLVQPTEAEFDGEYYKEYFSSFQVVLKALIRDINLSLVEKSSSCCVWERDVRLLPSKVTTSLFSSEQLNEIQSRIIDGISGASLKSLLDKLPEKNVITDNEKEEAEEMKNTRDKARFVIDTVKRKDGTPKMTEILWDIDPFLCKRLELI